MKLAGETDGILPAQAIRALIAAGAVAADPCIAPEQVQPASLDLRLGAEAVRVRASFLPGRGRVADKLAAFGLHTMQLEPGAVLETGCVYVAKLCERLYLPDTLSAVANPKSSTGRLDVFTRLIADGEASFDRVGPGFTGPLYAEICPQTFPVLVRRGSSLSQLRFRRGAAAADDAALGALHKAEQLVDSKADISGGLALSVALDGPAGTIVGYRAKRHTGLIDIDAKAACTIADYWEPIVSDSSGRLILDPDQFYILASQESVVVPPSHAAEMVPFNPLVGEFRVHYAGFFDPGFGHHLANGTGARIVLEVRSHKVPFVLEHGQVVGRVIYEKLTEAPDRLYGASIGSHYQQQGLALSKHFR